MSTVPLDPVPVFGSPSDPFYGLGDNGSYNGGLWSVGPVGPPAVPGLPPPNPSFYGRAAMTNGNAVFDAAEAGDQFAAIERFFEGLSARDASFVLGQFSIWTAFQVALSEGYNRPLAATDAGMLAEGRAAISTLAGLYVTAAGNYPTYTENPSFDFWGTPFMPLAGMYYWFAGEGKTRRVRIGSLNLQLVVTDFAPIMAVLDDSSVLPGTYDISAPFTYNIFSRAPLDLYAAGLLGRVSGTVHGQLTINPDNSYVFNGAYTIDPDTYDADSSNRPFAQEALTTFLSDLGDKLGHTTYVIEVVGEQPVQFSGSR